MISIDRHGMIEVYRPNGALKAELLSELREVINLSLGHGRPSIILDLGDISLLDSAALQWLLEVDEQCAVRGGNLSIVGGNDLVHEILRLTGVGNRLLCFDELSEAMECCV